MATHNIDMRKHHCTRGSRLNQRQIWLAVHLPLILSHRERHPFDRDDVIETSVSREQLLSLRRNSYCLQKNLPSTFAVGLPDAQATNRHSTRQCDSNFTTTSSGCGQICRSFADFCYWLQRMCRRQAAV